MGKRLLFGPVMIALLIAGLFLDHRITAFRLPAAFINRLPSDWSQGNWPPGTIILPIVLALVILAARELAAMLESEGIEGSKRMATFAAVVGVLVSCLVPTVVSVTTAVALVTSAAAAVLVTAMAFYSRHKTVEGVIAATGGVLLSFVYLGLMAGFLLAIRREYEVVVLGWVILMVKACDIGAYFTGKAFGKHKLIPWLSPGKTWEGLYGGVALSAIVGITGALLGGPVPSWAQPSASSAKPATCSKASSNATPAKKTAAAASQALAESWTSSIPHFSLPPSPSGGSVSSPNVATSSLCPPLVPNS